MPNFVLYINIFNFDSATFSPKREKLFNFFKSTHEAAVRTQRCLGNPCRAPNTCRFTIAVIVNVINLCPELKYEEIINSKAGVIIEVKSMSS